MKKLFALLFWVLAINSSFAQWLQQNSGTSNTLRSVHFIDSNIGFVVGNLGTILKTTDGGVNWVQQNSGTSCDLTSVFFIDSISGYAVGSNFDLNIGIILQTTDGGTNWSLQSPPMGSGSLRSVYFVNKNKGFICESSGNRILRTTNGGLEWVPYTLKTTEHVASFSFTDENTGYAAGGFYILKTDDGGSSWTSLSWMTEIASLRDIHFPSADTGYGVGGSHSTDGTSRYYVVKTTDGGANWVMHKTPNTDSTQPLNSVYFTSANKGYAVGDDCMILTTIDGGTNWTSQSKPVSNYLLSVYFPTKDTGYIVGSGGTILKTTNGGGFVSINEPLPAKSIFNLYPNPATNKITISTNRILAGETRISIISISGQQLMQARFQNQNTMEMNVRGLSKGIYVVKIQTDAGIETKKLVIH